MASLVTAYAALRPRDGFSHPHQEHMKDTYIPIYLINNSITLCQAKLCLFMMSMPAYEICQIHTQKALRVSIFFFNFYNFSCCSFSKNKSDPPPYKFSQILHPSLYICVGYSVECLHLGFQGLKVQSSLGVANVGCYY